MKHRIAMIQYWLLSYCRDVLYSPIRTIVVSLANISDHNCNDNKGHDNLQNPTRIPDATAKMFQRVSAFLDVNAELEV